MLAASVSASLLDFVFRARAAQTIGRGAALFRFFGLYYTATSLLTFLVQTFASRLCLKRAGLSASAGALPAAVSMGSLLSAVFPGFNLLSGVRGMEIVIRGSLYRSAYELFYTAVSPGDKRSAKSLIDVGVERVGELLGAGTVGLILVLSPRRYSLILFAAAGASAIALLFATRLDRGYIRALEKSLFDRAVELDPSLVHDSTTRSVLMRSVEIPSAHLAGDAPVAVAPPRSAVVDLFLRRAADLRCGEVERVIAAATEIRPDDRNLVPLLIELLAWDEVMPAARSALERLGPGIAGILIDAMLDPDCDFVIRRRVPRVLAKIPSARSAEGLFEALQDHAFRSAFLCRARTPSADQRSPGSNDPSGSGMARAQLRALASAFRLGESPAARSPGSDEKKWFFDDQLLDRADRNLEHLFTSAGIAASR